MDKMQFTLSFESNGCGGKNLLQNSGNSSTGSSFDQKDFTGLVKQRLAHGILKLEFLLRISI